MARAKTTAVIVPQSDGEAETLIARMGAIDRELAIEEARQDDVIAQAEQRYAERKKTLEAERRTCFDRVVLWAAAHRERLTQGGKSKSVQLPTGRIEWRDEPPSVRLDGRKASKGGREIVSLVLARLKDLGAQMAGLAVRDRRRRPLQEQAEALQGFLRVATTLNREAMHANRALAETLPGVTIAGGGETVEVEPLASQIREVA